MQRAIETSCLFVLIVLAAIRPLVAESYDSGGTTTAPALAEVADPSPVATLLFDVLILATACGWLLARAIGAPRRYRPTGLEWGLGLIAVAAAISCFAAGNKRLAINAAIDWLCHPILAIVLVQLMHRPWHRRLLLAAVLGSACAQAVQCYDQAFVTTDDTLAHYHATKAEFWAKQGVDLESPTVELFERRMLAREASGFLPHSNVTGSYLVLCGFAALGLTIAAWKRAANTRAGLVVAGGGALTVAIFSAVFFTKSRGAALATLAGLCLWGVLWLFAGWIGRHRRGAVALGWLCALLGLAAVVGHGLYHGSLPGASLNFRWQYWTASADLIADHWLTGVGRENFGRHYLRYKSIEASEEIANPHNLLVQAAADWGMVGLVGLAVMSIGESLAVTRRKSVTEPETTPARLTRPPDSFGSAALIWTIFLAVAVTLVRLPLLGTTDPNFLYVSSVMTAVPWLVGFLFLLHVAGFVTDGAARRTLSTGIAIGLFTLLLHELINFALFVPGSAMTFFALLAVCLTERSDAEPIRGHAGAKHRWLPVLLSGLVTLAAVAIGLWPVAAAARHLRLARQTGQHMTADPVAAQPTDRHFQRAAAIDPLDPSPLTARTDWLLALSSDPLRREEAFALAIKSLDEAVRRDPHAVRHRRAMMRLYRMRASASGRVEDYLAAVEAGRAATQLYPNDPTGYVQLAEMQFAAGEAAQVEDLVREAVANLRHAVHLDDSRPGWEIIRRFSKRQRDEIEAQIARAEEFLPGTR